MCGRFLMDENAFLAAMKIAKMPQYIQPELPLGMIYPSMKALILKEENHELVGDLKEFGIKIPIQKKEKLVINARAETALEKYSFRYDLLHHRCVIVCSLFYEWDKAKERYSFFKEDQPALYLAGFYNDQGFIILTTSANENTWDIHPRMPLVLLEEQVKSWIEDTSKVQYYLEMRPEEMSYESQSLRLF